MDGPCAEHKEGTSPAEPGACEHEELGVTEAHADLSAPDFGVEDDEREPHDAEADSRAEEGVGEAHRSKRGGGDAQDRAAEGDRVGQDHVLEVDEGGGDEGEGEGEVGGVDGEGEEPADGFDERVAGRDLDLAAAGFAAEEGVAEEGDVVPGADGFAARGAA